MASTAAKAATATWRTASTKKNASGSCSPATSPNSPRCHRARSCRSWRTGACSLAQSAASIGCCSAMARPPQKPRPVQRLRVDGPNQAWSWDIAYLPTTVRGVWLYLYLVIDVWSRKVVAWDGAEREDPAIAADLVSRACLRERISKGCRQPLILHADNGNAIRAATLESRMEELGVFRSFSRPRVSNDTLTPNHCSGRQNTGPTTQTAHSSTRRPPTSG